jgi:cell division septation protein DedD
MVADGRDSEVRELRLEGVGLFVIGGVLVAALAGAFFVGRWYERSVNPIPAAGLPSDDPLAHVVQTEDPAEVDDTATFFDTMQGQQAEPDRETAQPGSPPVSAAPAGDSTPSPAKSPQAGGAYFVQVFAGRDRSAAEALVQQLQSSGHAVRIFTQREGQGSLYKVRVGGFADEPAARVAAETLQKEGFAGAWVTRLED